MKVPSLLLFLALILSKFSFGSCVTDDRTLTEMLFLQKAVTVYSCKILTSTTDENGFYYSSAEILEVYIGKVASKSITLGTGGAHVSTGGAILTGGKTYLVYTGKGEGQNETYFRCCSPCDYYTKQITDIPDSSYEVKLLKDFAGIFSEKKSGKFVFKNEKGIKIAEGKYKEGVAVGVWKHYYNNGVVKAIYNLKNGFQSQFSSNGAILRRATVQSNQVSTYEQFKNGILNYKQIKTLNDTGYVYQFFFFYENGQIQKLSKQAYLILPNGYEKGKGKIGDYKEYFENGRLQVSGQYFQDKKIGIWKTYNNEGSLISQVDYKDGVTEP